MICKSNSWVSRCDFFLRPVLAQIIFFLTMMLNIIGINTTFYRFQSLIPNIISLNLTRTWRQVLQIFLSIILIRGKLRVLVDFPKVTQGTRTRHTSSKSPLFCSSVVLYTSCLNITEMSFLLGRTLRRSVSQPHTPLPLSNFCLSPYPLSFPLLGRHVLSAMWRKLVMPVQRTKTSQALLIVAESTALNYWRHQSPSGHRYLDRNHDTWVQSPT